MNFDTLTNLNFLQDSNPIIDTDNIELGTTERSDIENIQPDTTIKKAKKLDLFNDSYPYQYHIVDKNNDMEYILERSRNTETTEEAKIITTKITLASKSTKEDISKILNDSSLDDLWELFDDDNESQVFPETIFSPTNQTEYDVEPDEDNLDIDTDENRVADSLVNPDTLVELKHQGEYNGNYTYNGYSIEYSLVVKDIHLALPRKPDMSRVQYTSKSDVEKYEAGDPKLIEDMTYILNFLTMYDYSSATLLNRNYEYIGSTYCSLDTYNSPQGKVVKYLSDSSGKVIKEEFSNKDYDITRIRFTSTGKSYNPNYNFKFKDSEFAIDYTKSVATNINPSQAKAISKTFSSRCIYLPKPQELIERYNLNMDYIDSAEYVIVNTEEKLIEVIDKCKQEMGDTGVVAYDAETTGLHFSKYSKNQDVLCAHCISWKDGSSYIIPVRMKYVQNIEPSVAAKHLKRVLEVNPILAHNGMADVRFLTGDNIELNLQEDTMHLIKFVLPFITDFPAVGFGRYLDDLCKRMFGYDMIDMKKMVYDPSNATFDFSVVNEEYLIYYGCPDTDLCRRLWKVLRAKLKPEQLRPYRNAVVFSRNLAIHSSYVGVGIDVDMIQNEISDSEILSKKMEEIIYAFTKEDKATLSLSSSQQKVNYIYGTLGATVEEAGKSPDAKPTADKYAITTLSKIPAKENRDTFKQDILDVKGNTVLKASDLNSSKYPFCLLVRVLDNLRSNINSNLKRLLNNSIDSIFNLNFSVGKTDTWRTIEGIQTIKSALKKAIRPPNNEVTEKLNEHWGWITTDYRTQEICLAANNSNDIKLIEILKDPESDLHSETAADLWNIKSYKVSKDLRSKAKICNFLLAYGGKAYALGQNIFGADRLTEEQFQEALSLYELYCYKRAEMLKPIQQSKQFVEENGYIINQLGYPMVYPQIIDKDKMISEVFDTSNLSNNIMPVIDIDKRRKNGSRLLNACGNYPIQSWASGILMVVYNKIAQKIKDDGYENLIYVPVTVHDEVGICYRTDLVHPYYLIHLQLETLVDEMTYLNKEHVTPLYVGIGFGNNWYQAKDDMAELPIKLQYILQKEYLEGKAPSREEIVQEGIYEHFRRRIKEYIIERTITALQEMYDNKHFIKTKVEYILTRDEMYIGKQLQGNFNVSDNNGINMEILMKTLYNLPLDKPLPDGYTFEEGNPIEDDIEEIDTDTVELFFVTGELNERVSISNKIMQINLSGLNVQVANNIKSYINHLCTTEYNIHNNQIIYIENNGAINRTDLQILSIPSNFIDTFKNLVNGGKLERDPRNPHKMISSHVYIRIENNSVIISSLFIDEAVKSGKINLVDRILNKHSSTSVIAQFPILVENYNTKDLADTGLRLIALKASMVDELLAVLEL